MNLPGRSSIQLRSIRILKDGINMEIPYTQRDLDVQPERPNANTARSLVILVACATGKQEAYKEGTRSPKAHQLTCKTVFTRYDDSDSSSTEEEKEPFCLQLKILDNSSQEEQSEAEQSQPGEKIAQSNRHSKKPKKAMWLKKPAKSIQVNQ